MAKAVVIIDMLNDFAEEGGALYVPGAERLVEKIGQLKGTAYEQGVYVIYANDNHAENDPEFKTWPKHAVTGTYGAQVIAQLTPTEQDTVYEKQDLSFFTNPEADKDMKAKGIDELILTGVATNLCVTEAALDALKKQYKVNIVVDAVAGIDINPGDQANALMKMGAAGAKPLYTAQALEYMVR